MSDARGWTAWVKMCKEAKRRPLPPLNPNQPFHGDQRLRVRARKDRYPLPLIRETLQLLVKAKWFTKLDVI